MIYLTCLKYLTYSVYKIIDKSIHSDQLININVAEVKIQNLLHGCNLCNCIFENSRSLISHIYSAHNETDDTKKFICHFCAQDDFTNYAALYKHLRTHKKLFCILCQKFFCEVSKISHCRSSRHIKEISHTPEVEFTRVYDNLDVHKAALHNLRVVQTAINNTLRIPENQPSGLNLTECVLQNLNSMKSLIEKDLNIYNLEEDNAIISSSMRQSSEQIEYNSLQRKTHWNNILNF